LTAKFTRSPSKEIMAKEIIRGLDAPASVSRTEEQHTRLVDGVFREIEKHPNGTYGAKARDGAELIDFHLDRPSMNNLASKP
jgi:hypothetical protein